MRRSNSIALVIILWLGLALRLAPLNQNRFLEDEALYAYWGLQIATGADPMLDREPVDKPPLFPYLLALSFIFLGRDETAARIPNLVSSVTGIALIYALARRYLLATRSPFLPGNRESEAGALLAALLLALSPFDLLFASTAFTDPLMTTLMLGALYAAAQDRPGASGVLAGLMVATKQQGLFFLPLVIAFWWLFQAPYRSRQGAERHSVSGFASKTRSLPLGQVCRIWRNRWLRLAFGFALVVAGTLAWDAARLQRPGFLTQSWISYGGLKFTHWTQLTTRIHGWLQWLRFFWVSPGVNALLMGGLAFWIIASHQLQAIPRPGPADWTLLLFLIGYLVIHGVLSFQIWDRYLLPLIPLVALLTTRGFVGLSQAIQPDPWKRVLIIGLALFLVASLWSPAVSAIQGRLPVGGDHGAYDGIDQLAAYLRTQVPARSVLYHHWLGYHYRFYLYGSSLVQHWYPDVEDLVHHATVYRREPRYIAFPSWRDSTFIQKALAEAGITLSPVFHTLRRDGTISFRLYQMRGP